MRVTIVPEDKYIAVNKRGLNFDFPADANIHAIQWYDDQGVVELKVGGSRPATLAEVQPFIDAWEAERVIVDTPPPVVPPPIPQVVSKYQGCAALAEAGYLDGVEAYFASASATAEEKLAWRTISEMRRTSPMTMKLAGMLGLTSTQVDDLFILAATKVA